MLNKLTEGKYSLFHKAYLGLYRDDGLAVVKIRGRPGKKLEDLSENVMKLFQKEDLRIEVQHGMTNTDFLDVKLNLEENEYWMHFQVHTRPADSIATVQ